MTEEESEPAWVRAAQAGSTEAFGQLVRLHQQKLRAFLRRLCGNHAEADDLAQETFVFVWERMVRYDPERSFRAWLFGIAWRKHRQSRRGWARLLARETKWHETREPVSVVDPGLRMDLTAACAALPADQRAAILLCLGMEFTHEEAAEALALPLGTVKSHITRGRAKLAGLLGDEP